MRGPLIAYCVKHQFGMTVSCLGFYMCNRMDEGIRTDNRSIAWISRLKHPVTGGVDASVFEMVSSNCRESTVTAMNGVWRMVVPFSSGFATITWSRLTKQSVVPSARVNFLKFISVMCLICQERGGAMALRPWAVPLEPEAARKQARRIGQPEGFTWRPRRSRSSLR